MRVLVLGASGFIGRRIVAALGERGDIEAVAASRNATRRQWPAGVTALDVDAADPSALRGAMGGADAVVNCIAGAPSAILAVSRELLGAAGAVTPRPRIIQFGSLAAYGSASGLVDESAELRGDLGDYSAAKAQCDVLGAQHSFVVSLRPGIVYGPESPWWSDRIARLLMTRRLGDLGPEGSGICNLVYVDDVAAAVSRALELRDLKQRAFNLSGSGDLTWNEYFSKYAAALGAPPPRKISRRRLELETSLLSPPLKLLELLLRSPAWARWNPHPPIRPWLPALCASRLQMASTAAETVLGMRWTPLETGLARTAAWFRQGGRTALP